MSWIKHVFYEESKGRLRKIYDRIKGKNNYIDNILTVHGLRPHTLEGHMSLYKSVLHHSSNELPKWLLEALGVYVSYINNCSYCFEHHFAGFKTLLNDDEKALGFRKSVVNDAVDNFFEKKEAILFQYAKELTHDLKNISEETVQQLKNTGYNDGQILEANQVISYFAYANRTVLGLGVTTEGDILGLSPSDSDDPNNWGHSEAKA